MERYVVVMTSWSDRSGEGGHTCAPLPVLLHYWIDHVDHTATSPLHSLKDNLYNLKGEQQAIIMQESKKFAFDVSMTFIASGIAMVLSYIITILLGRYVGADSLGLYRMCSSIYSIAMVVAAVGIPSAMVKYAAESKDDRAKFSQIVSSGVTTSLGFGILFIVLFYFLSGTFAEIFRMPALAQPVKVISLAFPFALVASVLIGMLNGIKEMGKYNSAIILQGVLLIVITTPLIYYGFEVTGAVAGVVLSSFGYFLFVIWVSKDYYDTTLKEYCATTKKMLRFGSQIFGANAVDLVNYKADILLTGYFLAAADVGHYAAAVGLSRFFWLVPNAIQRITYPTTSEYWAQNDHAKLHVMINKSMKYAACILLPLTLGIGLFARDIITFIFGEGFIPAVAPLQILLLGTVVNGSTFRAIGGSLAGVGRPDIILKLVSISAITNIALNIVLIPTIGIVGAALATTVSLSVFTFLGLYFTAHILNVSIDFSWFAKICGVTLLFVAASAASGFIDRYLLYVSILSSYVLVILFFFFTKEDRAYFMGLVRDTLLFLKQLL